MKTSIRLFLLLICIQQQINGQTQSDTLVIRKMDREASLYMFNKADPRDKAIYNEAKQMGFFVFQGKEKLAWAQVVEKVKHNDAAGKKINKVKNIYNFQFAFETLAVLGVATYSLVYSFTGSHNPSTRENLQFIGIGFGSLFAAIITKNIIGNSAYRPAKAAIDIYNNDLKTQTGWQKPEVGLGLTRNGFGLVLKF